MGQSHCMVGPFSGRVVAEHFANVVVDFGRYETVQERVFARRDCYYVEFAPLGPAAVVDDLAPRIGGQAR